MGTADSIAAFVALFSRNRSQYKIVEKDVEILCKNALKGFDFLWQSRVKAPQSLEVKLKARNEKYNNEAENIADACDLVAGRIILARWLDIERVEKVLGRTFNIVNRSQHPKPGRDIGNSQARFRGYDGLHFYVTRQIPSSASLYNLVIEIQVMSAFMWAFTVLDHDIIYKKISGEPDNGLIQSLDLLKGIANVGEIGLQMFDAHFLPAVKHAAQQHGVGSALQATIRSVADEINFDENDKQCLRDLRLTDPRHDKERIEASKDHLLDGSCSWVLEDSAFVNWWTRGDSRLLWIHGDPGKGKTMMMIALISELSKRLNNRPGNHVLAYFFCQNASNDLSTTVSVLRGLIYHLVDQEKKLICHVRKTYDSAGKQLFEGPNALYALRAILSDILKDESLGDVYFMIDALDECDTRIQELLDWIIHEDSKMSPKVKWLTTSRNVPAFTQQLGSHDQLHTSLELNSLHVTRAVNKFIDYKVKELAKLKSYARGLQDFVHKSLLQKAEDTFLWVALVCKELNKVRLQKVRALLESLPAGLIPLYKRMLEQVFHQEDQNDVEICRRVLCLVTLAFRPLRLKEIAIFANIPDDEDVEELLGLCGSFLTIRKDTVYLVHQSAKDYLSDDKGKLIFHLGRDHEHASLASLCLTIMSTTLRKDLCNLRIPGVLLSNIDLSDLDAQIPLHAQYACVYWAVHLQQAGSSRQETFTLGEDCRVLRFFQHHFLHWLEATILMSKYSEAILAMRSFGSTQKVKPPVKIERT